MKITPDQIAALADAERKLALVYTTVGNVRLAGLDQNPMGWRDLLGSTVSDLHRLLVGLQRDDVTLPSRETRKSYEANLKEAHAEARSLRKAREEAERQVRSLSAENARLRRELASAQATLRSVNLGRN